MAVKKKSIKTGRPEAIINWKQLETLCVIQCTQDEICAVLNLDHETINKHCKKTHNLSFSVFFKQKRLGGKASLRRAQWLNATENNNPTLQIWLGKQLLGQTDKQEISQTQEIKINIDKDDLSM